MSDEKLDLDAIKARMAAAGRTTQALNSPLMRSWIDMHSVVAEVERRGRVIADLEGAITTHAEAENQQLREENARLKADLEAATAFEMSVFAVVKAPGGRWVVQDERVDDEEDGEVSRYDTRDEALARARELAGAKKTGGA